MEVHCSYCDNIASIDVSDLEPITPASTLGLDGIVPEGEAAASNVNPGNGIPFKFEDIVQCIRDQLIYWEVALEPDEEGVETLKLTCDRHNQAKHLKALALEHTPRDAVPNLEEFLLMVESHLRTTAENTGSLYSVELANTSRQLLNYIKSISLD